MVTCIFLDYINRKREKLMLNPVLKNTVDQEMTTSHTRTLDQLKLTMNQFVTTVGGGGHEGEIWSAAIPIHTVPTTAFSLTRRAETFIRYSPFKLHMRLKIDWASIGSTPSYQFAYYVFKMFDSSNTTTGYPQPKAVFQYFTAAGSSELNVPVALASPFTTNLIRNPEAVPWKIIKHNQTRIFKRTDISIDIMDFIIRMPASRIQYTATDGTTCDGNHMFVCILTDLPINEYATFGAHWRLTWFETD